MADEELSIAENEEPNPSLEVENDQTDDEIVSLDDFDLDDDVQDQEEPADEIEDDEEPEAEPSEYAVVEIEGQEYEVPNALKDGYLRQADYTRKTQEIAETRRELERREEALVQQTQVSEEELRDRVTVMNLKETLEKYEKVDWDQAEQEDPAGAQKHYRNFQKLKEQHNEAMKRLGERNSERTEIAEQETATRLQQTIEFAKNNIEGWTEEIDTKIGAFAVDELGFEPEELKSAYNPQVYNALYLAWIGHQSLQNQAKAKPTPRVSAKPLKRVSAKSASTVKKSYDDMSMEEFAKAREGK